MWRPEWERGWGKNGYMYMYGWVSSLFTWNYCSIGSSAMLSAKPLHSVLLFATLWTVAHQAPLSTGFFRQEYCSDMPCPPPGDLPDSGIKPTSFMSPALAGRFFTTSTTWEACYLAISQYKIKSSEEKKKEWNMPLSVKMHLIPKILLKKVKHLNNNLYVDYKLK